VRIAIILNGISRKKKKFYESILPVLQQKFSISIFETRFANHAHQLAAAAVTDKYDIILSAGGDGTLHQVVNGMLSIAHPNQLPALGLIRLGSGNDFANTIGATANPAELLELLSINQPRPIDLGKLICKDVNNQELVKYFINACSVGMGPATVKQMAKAPQWLGADLRYLLSIVRAFFAHKPEPIEIKTYDWNWVGKARVLAIANGKSFGSKIYIAPDAKPDDGVFSTFLVSDIPLLKFLFYLQVVKKKKRVDDRSVVYSTTTKIEITTPQSVAIEAEGELMGFLPAVIEVLPEQIKFLRK
jgi:diacylglycerol kinase (ATP)